MKCFRSLLQKLHCGDQGPWLGSVCLEVGMLARNVTGWLIPRSCYSCPSLADSGWGAQEETQKTERAINKSTPSSKNNLKIKYFERFVLFMVASIEVQLQVTVTTMTVGTAMK